MFCIGIKMDTAFLKGKRGFGFEETITINTSNEILHDFRDSLILKNVELVYGVIPANAIIKYVSQHVGKSRLDLLSNFETFSRNIIEVYGEVEGKKFLSKLDVKCLWNYCDSIEKRVYNYVKFVLLSQHNLITKL